MWTDQERELAANISKNPEMMALLKKIYCPDRFAIRTELEALVNLPDEQYGQLMRSLAIAERHFVQAHADIVRIATKETTRRTPIAPK